MFVIVEEGLQRFLMLTNLSILLLFNWSNATFSMLYLRICANRILPLVLHFLVVYVVNRWAWLSSTVKRLFLGKCCIYASTVLNLSSKLILFLVGSQVSMLSYQNPFSALQGATLFFLLILAPEMIPTEFSLIVLFCWWLSWFFTGTQKITTPYWNSKDRMNVLCSSWGTADLTGTQNITAILLGLKRSNPNVLCAPCAPNSNVLSSPCRPN